MWATATQWGKQAYVVKFPLSYPSVQASFRLDGAAGWGGIKCMHEAASSSVGATDGAGPATTRIRPDDEPWGNEQDLSGKAVWRGVWLLPALWRDVKIELFVVILKSGDGDLSLAVSTARDANSALTRLRPGEWSEPLTLDAPGRRGRVTCSFRVKALQCETEPVTLRLFNTTLHERTGHSHPDPIWQRHLGATGPIEEQTEPSLVFHAGLDVRSQIEVFRLNAEWLRRTAAVLLRNEPWDLFMVQIHIVDWAHHLLHGKVDPRHPDYDATEAPTYEALLLECYQLADALVRTVLESVENDANVVVLGDHGQDLKHSSLHLNEWLCAAGLLKWANDGDEVDWSRTRAYGAGSYIYLNLQGREPNGIVLLSEADELTETILAGLRRLTDPESDEPIILVADRKENFRDLGGDGAGVGDVVFCCRSGYQSTNARGPVISRTVALREFTSGHDHFWPRDPRIQTAMFAAGPSFRRGYEAQSTATLTDVAPTICAVLGIPPPAHSQGVELRELFSKGTASETAPRNPIEEEISSCPQ
jgi:predicted AlkP superfamily phosphohydrolase/phosphomutase